MKLLLWVLLIAAVIWILRKKATVASAAAPGRRSISAPEPMVVCAHCGIHFPSSEAVVDASGAAFCSDEHRRLHTFR